MIFYNGLPKNLIESKQKVERLNFAREKWFSKHGLNIFSLDKVTAEEARKLFKYIDFNKANVISKHQIQLLIHYFLSEFP
jgi:hypothetical protein